MTRTTFALVGETSTVTLCMPTWANEDNSIDKDIQLINFWDNSLDTTDKGINTQPLVIGGVECASDSHSGLCIPFCVPFCFTDRLCNEVTERLRVMMNNGEQVTISDLGDCQNGVYVVKDFTWDTIKRIPACYRWSLTLELVRRIE